MLEFIYNEECNYSYLRSDGILYVTYWPTGYVGIIIGWDLMRYERVF